jgi:cytochrome c peroxidase
VAAEGTYGWHAESPVLTHRLINGFSLHRWNDSEVPYERKELFQRAMALRAFLRKGLVPPPHEERELSDREKRGRDVFLGAGTGCSVCHVPATEYTDREVYPVFASLPVPHGFADDPEKAYKTPSLRFVGGTPPYLHDGRFATLGALLLGNDDHMGKTNQLSATDKDALVAFLETL